MRQVEQRRHVHVGWPVQFRGPPEQRQTAGMLDPSTLVGNVAHPRVVVGIGIQVRKAKDRSREEDGDHTPQASLGHYPGSAVT